MSIDISRYFSHRIEIVIIKRKTTDSYLICIIYSYTPVLFTVHYYVVKTSLPKYLKFKIRVSASRSSTPESTSPFGKYFHYKLILSCNKVLLFSSLLDSYFQESGQIGRNSVFSPWTCVKPQKAIASGKEMLNQLAIQENEQSSNSKE